QHMAGLIDAVPDGGIGYGILRYLKGSFDVEHPQLVFNYLGQSAASGEGWRLAHGEAGQSRHPLSKRRQVIDVNAQGFDDRLEVTFQTSPSLDPDVLASAFEQAMADLFAGLNGETLSVPAAPMQTEFFDHCERAPEIPLYVNQTVVEIKVGLTEATFRAAWQDLVDREEILRTGFARSPEGEVFQKISPEAVIEIEFLDWQNANADTALDEFLPKDRARAFDLGEPPLMRLTVAKLGEDRFWVVWTRHHLLTDAWSTGQMFSDFAVLYLARSGLGEMPTARPKYRDFLPLLTDPGTDASADYWRETLNGAQLRMLQPNSGAEPAEFHQSDRSLGQALSNRLRAHASAKSVTLNTLIQTGWAIALSRYAKTSNVTFGVTSFGPRESSSEARRVIGPFLNVTPLRLQLPEKGILDHVKQAGLDLLAHNLMPLRRIKKITGVPVDQDLFDTMIIFENDALQSGGALPGGIEMTPVAAYERWIYPIVLIVLPHDEIVVRYGVDLDAIGQDRADELFEGFVEALNWLVS
ncbi:MAG: condensation domain-containing protein, partial [Pseudomonadota bacterium]